MGRKALIIGSVAILVAAGVYVSRGDDVAYETPSYRVVDTFDAVEIREYDPYLVAETTVDGSLQSAGNSGFRILARYIFGDNQGDRKIAMTAPVTQEGSEGTKIAMTAPVTQEKHGGKYTIRFMMPSKYTRADLPVPNDARITIREVPSRTFAAVRYSGTWSKRNYQRHLNALLDTLRTQGYEPAGEPIWARYNSPFTPWFLRRNEILTEFVVSVSER